MKQNVKRLVVAILAITMVLGLVPMKSEEAEAASALVFNSHCDFPMLAEANGQAFNSNIAVAQGESISSLQGWTAMKNYYALAYYWKYEFRGKTYKEFMTYGRRDDVRDAYKKEAAKGNSAFAGYSSFTGYQLSKSISFPDVPALSIVKLQIYAQVTSVTAPGRDVRDVLVGTYNVTIAKPAKAVLATAQNEYNIWTRSYLGKTAKDKQTKINQYFQKVVGRDWVIGESWCAAFASYCLLTNGYEAFLPVQTSQWGRGRLYCEDMRSTFDSLQQYVTNYTRDRAAVLNKVKPGDVVFFMGGEKIPNVTHHVGIVKSVNKSARKITYIDGNGGDYGDILCREFDLDWSPYGNTDYYIIGFGLLHK